MQNVKDIKEAIGVLIQAAEIGQSKGIFSLSEARLIAESIDFFIIKNEKQNDDTKKAE